ncbi:MAG: lipoyl(octanoyl) transferase LipB [Gammaproteobacteria bacterium]|nr:lipoyl(octanoyl) transferase LipB [Gammaproteobacteria bacterium]
MKLTCRYFARNDYNAMLKSMQAFTDTRNEDTNDELWLTEHNPVFTLGRAGKEEHILNAGNIPVVRSDRGGQVTYHGPGQLIGYMLFDLKRLNLGVKRFVAKTEQVLINFLSDNHIQGVRRDGAPGVYVDEAKIAALGLRIRRHRAYHGFSLNVNMDLAPFSRINPCGYANLSVTDLQTLGLNHTFGSASDTLCAQIQHIFGYTGLLIDEHAVITNDRTQGT